MVRILSQTVVHKRKDTLLGAFIHQILFQGKEALRGPEKKKKYIYIYIYNKSTHQKTLSESISNSKDHQPHPLAIWNK